MNEQGQGESSGQRTSVLVVDDHRTFADLLSFALSGEPDLECVGAAHDIEKGLALAIALKPDVVIMDVRVGTGDGIEATAALTELLPETRVVVLTAHASQPLLERAAAAGACCLLPKDGSLVEMLSALRTARRDGFVVHPTLLKTLIESRRQPETPVPGLTVREHEVLDLLAEGVYVGSIAQTLGISVSTCRGYVRGLFTKLDAHSQLEAVAIAKRLGLVGDGEPQ